MQIQHSLNLFIVIQSNYAYRKETVNLLKATQTSIPRKDEFIFNISLSEILSCDFCKNISKNSKGFLKKFGIIRITFHSPCHLKFERFIFSKKVRYLICIIASLTWLNTAINVRLI